MSISGYVPNPYQLTVVDTNGDSHLIASNQIVQDIKIYRKHNKVWSEIAVPCIVYQAVYRLEVKINTLALEDHFSDGLTDENVSLQLFETLNEGDETTKFKKWKYKKSKDAKVELLGDKLTAIMYFSLDANYSSHRNKSFINIALKIQDITLKYITCDLGVVTNSSQISSDYKIFCSGLLRKTFNLSFWGKSSDCYGALASKPKKKSPTSDEDVDSNEQSDPNSLSASRETKSVKLQMIIQSVEECLKRVQEIEDEPDQDSRIANVFLELNTSVSRMLDGSQMIVPGHLLIMPPPFLMETMDFGDFMDFPN
ncbi:MAG: hypothetical protein LLF94_07655 [Chlamydiales bacterium]|nr:hypothetical protein [Chlamydiales bacterium]